MVPRIFLYQAPPVRYSMGMSTQDLLLPLLKRNKPMKQNALIYSLLAILLSGGVCLPQADAGSASPSNEIKALLATWETLNDRCRGGSGEDRKTMDACDEREKTGGQLGSQGWCYGEPGQAGYQKKWQPCTEEQMHTVEAVSLRNNNKLVVTWTTLKPGQKDKSGFGLALDGSLSHAGRPIQPKVKVQDDQGKPSNRPPSEVRISPPSPSGQWAFMTACEPSVSESNQCAFQFLIDIKNGQLHELYWTKYGQPAHVWWEKEEAYAIIPISQEGDTWLSVVDIKKRDSRDVQMVDFVKQAEGALQCKLNESEPAYVIDLDSLEWLKSHEVNVAVTVLCERPAQVRSIKGQIDLVTGHLKRLSVNTPPPAAGRVKASFDCSKAASPVEKMICADGDLAGLDGQLGQLYKQSVSQGKNSDELKSQQMNWLRQVRNPCTTVVCLANAYRQRISALQQSADATPQATSSPSPFPATYVGGFTGKEKLVFTADGHVSEEGTPPGRHQVDRSPPWPDAKYPILITQQVDGQTQERHCKIQPDMRKMFCDEGRSMPSEFDRQGPSVAVAPSSTKKCDDEQLYLDVMAAARHILPKLELKGSTELTQDAQGKCHMTLYYLDEGQSVDVKVVYDMNVRPVKLTLVDAPPHTH